MEWGRDRSRCFRNVPGSLVVSDRIEVEQVLETKPNKTGESKTLDLIHLEGRRTEFSKCPLKFLSTRNLRVPSCSEIGRVCVCVRESVCVYFEEGILLTRVGWNLLYLPSSASQLLQQ